MSTVHKRRTCVIIGAGVSGLVQAAELVRHRVLKHEQISILERADDYRGVWTAATYPGAACDVFSILYQISWFKNPNWSGLFPTSQELVRYYNAFADYYGLRQSTTFRQNVIEAYWSDADCLWNVVSEDLDTSERTLWQCDVLIQAAGTYNRKKIPAVDGIKEFKGDMWHTVDWPEHYDFTAAVDVHLDSRITFTWIPGLLWLYAAIVSSGFGLWTWFVFRPGTWLARAEESYCERYLDRTISDRSLRERLRPTGRFGAKRPLVSPTFFDLVQLHNVEVVQESLLKVTEQGLLSTASPGSALHSKDPANRAASLELGEKATKRQFDTIIWGTGFQMQGWGSMIPTRGAQGKLLSEQWVDSPRTLFGTMTSGFPNLFIINGPNTVAPWASIIHGIEYQTASVARLIAWVMKQRESKAADNFWIMPKGMAQEDWTEALQGPLERLATSTKFGPGFYYLNKDGRNTFFFPFTLRYYWWRTRRVQKDLYTSSFEDGA